MSETIARIVPQIPTFRHRWSLEPFYLSLERTSLTGEFPLSPKVLTLFAVDIFVELWAATIPLFSTTIVSSLSTRDNFIFHICLGLVVSFLLLLTSILVTPRFWRQWRKIDLISLWAFGSIITYSYMVTQEEQTKQMLVPSIIAQILSVITLSGQVRVMNKWFPWSWRTLFIYKCLRLGQGLFFITITTIARGIGDSVSPPRLTYFTAMIIWINYLFMSVMVREGAVRSEIRAGFRRTPTTSLPSIPREQANDIDPNE